MGTRSELGGEGSSYPAFRPLQIAIAPGAILFAHVVGWWFFLFGRIGICKIEIENAIILV
jgi:hypothetical protein